MGISRREFSAALGFLGASHLLRAQPSGALPPECLGKTEGVRVDIDVHCHVFNGSDIQVERFLVLVASDTFNPFLRKVIQFLALPLQRSVWKHAPKATDELGKLVRSTSDRLVGFFAEITKETDGVYAQRFSEELATPEGKQFLDAYREYLDSVASESTATRRGIREVMPEAELDRLRDPAGLLRQLEREKRFANPSVASIFTFIRAFYAYRFEHVYYMLKNYGCDHGTIQMIAAALVDYDAPLAAPSATPSPLVDQFKLMARLCEVFQGRLLTYLAFDPWRIAKGDTSVWYAIKNDLTSGAAVGIKLYPPMGFAPLGNDRLDPFPHSWPAPQKAFGEKLEAAMEEMWAFATDLDVPVIAHAARSNAPYGDRVGLGSPENWQNVFNQYPKARVCFGHFGGQGLLEEEEDDWPSEFLSKVQRYPNAYGDIAYFEDVLKRQRLVGALAQRLSTFLSSSGALPEKMLYGSDWLMLAQEAHSELYFDRFAKLFANAKLFKPEWPSEILGANAQNFLGLHGGMRSRARLMQFYRTQGVNAAWLKEIA